MVIEETEKLFYSISEVAEILKVNQSTLRFWEKEFPSIRPTTNKKGNRMYTKKELELLSRIFDLVKVKGFTLQGAKDQLRKKKDNSTPTLELPSNEVREKLIGIKASLLQIKGQL